MRHSAPNAFTSRLVNAARKAHVAQNDLILNRYEPIGTAGEGGFGTVQVAWDPRIQRKVAIKTIRLTALDAARASLPGAQAVSDISTADRWHGVQPWDEFLSESMPGESSPADPIVPSGDFDYEGEDAASSIPSDQVTSMSHVPGLDEARTAAMLADPRIVTVYDFEVRGRTAYLIMEYIEGITLTQLLADYANYLTLDIVAAVFDSVAGALSAAHEAGVLHLDIKPDNILINAQGQVKVTDFGLATLADASGGGKAGGGTIGYMPPEQIRREKLDARADEWSLASVTYEMLTGSNPFRVKGLDAAQEAIEEAELVLPSLCWKDMDEQLDDVVFYALDPVRDERYASVQDFAEEAEKFLGRPEKGTAQLKLIVEDALGLDDWEDAGETDEDERGYDDASSASPGRGGGFLDSVLGRFGFGGNASAAAEPRRPSPSRQSPELPPARRGLTERFLDLLDDSESGAGAVRAGQGDFENADAAEYEPRAPHVPLGSRVSDRTTWLASHALGAVGSGFIAALSFANMQPISTALGPGSVYVIIALVAVVGLLGAIKSHIGALVSLCLLGIALVMCGHPIVGAVLLITTVGWWYTIGHDGAASANVALLLPLAGALGGATVVPFFAGATLPPLRALATTLFVAVLAVIFAGFGSMSILDWGALSHWDIVRADVSGSIIRTLSRADTWTTIASWAGAAAVLSLMRLRDSKALNVVSTALALVIVLAGSLVLTGPTPQVIVSAILAAAVLLAVEV
ncbi:MAG: serine/threonine protein kinase [Eggerthellaceae bacterium]|nr:serine/threonine protein kinase [Eggerthellaceae bacterium]